MATTQQVYTLTDLFESINDLHYQQDEGKIDASQANFLAELCCKEFIFNATKNNREIK